MGSKRHTCNCYDCLEARPEREAYRRGGIADGYEDTPYRKPGGWKSRKKCKKSKTGEPCDFTVPLIKHSWYNKRDNLWSYWRIWTCSRCGKHGPYNWNNRSTTLPER